MTVRVTIKSANLKKQVRNAARRSKAQLNQAVRRELAEPLAQEMRNTAPVDTGALRGSIQVRALPGESGWSVGFEGASRAGPGSPNQLQIRQIELFGHSRQAPRGFIRPSIQKVIPVGARRLRQRIESFLRKV